MADIIDVINLGVDMRSSIIRELTRFGWFYCARERIEPCFQLLPVAVESVEVDISVNARYFSYVAVLPQLPGSAPEGRVGEGAYPKVGSGTVEAVVALSDEASVAVFVGVYQRWSSPKRKYCYHRVESFADCFG